MKLKLYDGDYQTATHGEVAVIPLPFTLLKKLGWALGDEVEVSIQTAEAVLIISKVSGDEIV